MYISHMRSEGNALLEAVDELITIAREAGVPAEIYHLKAAGKDNWPQLDEVIRKVEAARAEGLRITADMYTYTAGATGLDAAMPPVGAGGRRTRRGSRASQDPAIRREWPARCARRPTSGRTCISLPAQPRTCSWSGFRNGRAASR